ncbi:MAG: STAS domain-containing protein [Phycicoccus sp.]|nr:STAS domain-containing protein [Phycicoccus sp.]NMM33689.1 STAS domain-containing protein [Phycicoccus sp.]
MTSPVRVAEIRVGQEVAVSGRLDVNTVAAVRLGLQSIMDRGVGDLLLHLADAEVHDATGLGVIVGAHHRAHGAGRRLVLVDVSPRLDRLLRATRLHRVLTRGPGEDPTTGLSLDPVVPLAAVVSANAVVPLTA